MSAAPEQKYLIAGSGGYGFVCSLQEMVSRVKAGKSFMTLEENEEPVMPVALVPEMDHVGALSGNGRLLVFTLAEMKEMPRGRGVIIMGLDEGEKLISVALCTRDKVAVHGINRAGKDVVAEVAGEEMTKHLLHRARKGCLVPYRLKPLYLTAS